MYLGQKLPKKSFRVPFLRQRSFFKSNERNIFEATELCEQSVRHQTVKPTSNQSYRKTIDYRIVIAISQILKCYILSPPLLLLQLSQNLHVGMKDVQKNLLKLEAKDVTNFESNWE